MNFTSPLRPAQLSFEFIDSPAEFEPLTPWARLGMGRTAFYARRRTQKAVSLAVELERRRRKPAAQTTRTGVLLARPFLPTSDESHELCRLARRIERLCRSHRSPERFHEDKSQIVYELRAI